MSWPVWMLVIVLGLATFGIGCIFARAMILHRDEHSDGDGLISDRRANAVLAVFFVFVAFVIAADTVHLQVRFSQFTRGQVECNTRMINSERRITEQRKAVDLAAAQYDVAEHEYLAVAALQPMVPRTDPAFLIVEGRLHELTLARLGMLQTYADNPFEKC